MAKETDELVKLISEGKVAVGLADQLGRHGTLKPADPDQLIVDVAFTTSADVQAFKTPLAQVIAGPRS
jgi:hypothetical protein